MKKTITLLITGIFNLFILLNYSGGAEKKFSNIFSGFGGAIGIAALFFLCPGTDRLTGAMIGGFCMGWGISLGYMLGDFIDALNDKSNTYNAPIVLPFSIIALILGLIGLVVAWLLPLAGIPVGLIGFLSGQKGKLTSRRGLALTGMCLNLICMFLSTGNVFLVTIAYLGKNF